MHHLHRRIAFSLLSVVLVASMGSSLLEHSHAQVADESFTDSGVIRVESDIFEMLALSDERDAQYVWILTKDGSFVEAGRERNFRTRFMEPGFYMLDGSVNSAEGELLYRKNFTIEVPQNRVLPEQYGQLVQSVPELRGTSISIPDSTRVVTLIPKTDEVRSMKLDTDTQVDTDGNGNPTDDSDAAMTLAAFDATPLHLWLTTGESREMQAELFLMDQTTNIQLLSLRESDDEDSAVPTGASMQFVERRNGEIKFSLDNEQIAASSPLVLYWDFGDGFQSLLTSPSHTYRENGEYTVTVKAFDLRDGRTVVSDEGRIMVTSVPETSSGTVIGTTSSESSSEEEIPVVEPTPGPASSFPWQQILLLGLLGIGAVLLGLFLVWIIRKIIGGSGQLQKTLEEVEARIVERKEKADVIDATPHLQIKRSPKPTEEPAPEPEVVEASPLPPEPSAPEVVERTPEPEASPELPEVNEEEAPAWLKKGLHADEASAEETPVAPASPETPSPLPPEPEPLPPEPAAEEPITPVTPNVSRVAALQESPYSAPAPQKEEATPASDTTDIKEVESPETPVPVASATPSTGTPAALTPQEQARLERERERKREKRQRYRENKRKREMESKESNVAPSTVSSPSIPPAPESPKAIPTPAAPVAAEPTTPPPAPTPALVAKTPTETPPSTEPLIPASMLEVTPEPETPAANPVASVESIASATPLVEPVQPPAQAALPTNLEGLLPAPEANTKNDGDIAFVIQADSLKKDEGTGTTSNTENTAK